MTRAFPAAVVMAQTLVALPFLVIALDGALRTGGGRYETVAATLGASPSTVFRRVTLPLVLPGLLKYFSNTPVEEALQKMVTAAVEQISQQTGTPGATPAGNPQGGNP